MNMRDQIEEWSNQMGYKGNIPKDFRSICNAKTEIIWQQIVQQVQPKQDITYKRRILLLHRLNKLQAKNKNVTADIPMKELEVWKRKKELEKELEQLNGEITLSEEKTHRLRTTCNQLYIKSENIEQKIQEYEGKVHLLGRFEEKLSEEIVSVKEKLDHCVSLTPVEEGEEGRSVTDDLHNVAEKLKSLLQARKCEVESNSICVTPKRTNHNMLPIVLSENCEELAKDVANLNENSSVREISELLRKHNRLTIWRELRRIEDGLEQKSRELSHTSLINESNKNKANNLKLYELHIRKALETMQYKNEAHKLQKKIVKCENDLYMKSFSNKHIRDDSLNRIKAYVQDMKVIVGFDAALNTLKNEYRVLAKNCTSNSQLQTMKGKIKELECSTQLFTGEFMDKYNLLKHMQQSIITHRDDWVFTVRKMKAFIEDFDWVEPLSTDLVSEQIHAFPQFSLNYNKQFVYTNNEETYVRNCLPHTIPFMEDMSDETATKLALLIETPFYFPDKILSDVSAKKLRLQKLKSLNELPNLKITETNYISTVQNQRDELKLDNAIDKIMLLIRSRKNARKNLSMPKIQEVMDLWLKMPMGDFIEPSRRFDGKPYEYYADLYNTYFKQL